MRNTLTGNRSFRHSHILTYFIGIKSFFNQMKLGAGLLILFVVMAINNCRFKQQYQVNTEGEFASEMVHFKPYKDNPVFKSTDSTTWDRHIRERGYILKEDSIYKLWYTGYSGTDEDPKSLGYATSPDGIHWTRYPGNPIFKKKWTEDVFVFKQGNKYYMYAEGKNDIAHWLTSIDGIHWEDQGDLVIRKVNGDTIPGPYGTPTVWVENGKWYLFYERNDEAIWLATSTDHGTWTNIQDAPVIAKGPEKYDLGAIAANQVVKFKGRYYIYYHASSMPMNTSTLWTSNVAMSTDLIHWIKYPGNPIVQGNHSSPITVFDGNSYRLYTMHPSVCLYIPYRSSDIK
jgi:beta-1,2-mannobiose phosphorylase / 1,2-beta-oligomannan phosphorylase